MKHLIVTLLFVFSLLASACSTSAPKSTQPSKSGPVADQKNPVAIPTRPEIITTTPELPPSATNTPQPTTATAQTSLYRDEQAGFELDYPTGWMMEASTKIGDRGSQGTLTSWQHPPRDLVKDRPAGSTLVALTVYKWEPTNDLAAFSAHRKEAWIASGSKILTEESVTLTGSHSAQIYQIETPDKLQAFFMVTVVGSDYLELSGDGDTALIQQLAMTTRVFSR